jgi:hypothetical protein
VQSVGTGTPSMSTGVNGVGACSRLSSTGSTGEADGDARSVASETACEAELVGEERPESVRGGVRAAGGSVGSEIRRGGRSHGSTASRVPCSGSSCGCGCVKDDMAASGSVRVGEARAQERVRGQRSRCGGRVDEAEPSPRRLRARAVRGVAEDSAAMTAASGEEQAPPRGYGRRHQ